VRAWLADMAELVDAGEVGPKTINNALTVFSVCMGMAADDGLIAANPCLRVKHLPVATREMDFLRLEEIPRYLDACPTYYRPLRAFCSAPAAGSRGARRALGGTSTWVTAASGSHASATATQAVRRRRTGSASAAWTSGRGSPMS
jgi:hypothetical protein